jgi:hypothetical protein
LRSLASSTSRIVCLELRLLMVYSSDLNV